MNTLDYFYPPIVSSYLPAAVQGTFLEIPFSFSPYDGGIHQVKAVHVSIQSQNTNVSIIDGVGLLEVSPSNHVVRITNPAILNKLQINNFYKIQLRFAKESAAASGATFDFRWLNNNLGNFSEWSSVCLVKIISKPTLFIENHWSVDNPELNTKKYGDFHFTGYLSFADPADKEFLKSYRFRLFGPDNDEENSKEILLADSGVIMADSFNPNKLSFQYNVDLKTNNKIDYQLWVDYSTSNGYSPETYKYVFKVEATFGLDPLITFIPYSLSEDGGIKLKFIQKGSDDVNVTGNYLISRASIFDNYTKWEDMHMFALTPEMVDEAKKKQQDKIDDKIVLYDWTDYSVEPGHIYRYGLQTIVITKDQEDKTIETRSVRQKDIDQTVLVNSEHIFLFDGKKNLKIKYNPKISSLKKTVIESRTETLGAQFPFIRRNANVGYKQFPINGLISYNMDDIQYYNTWTVEACGPGSDIESQNQHFETKLPFLENWSQINESLKALNTLDERFSKSIYLERIFRESVMDFLYADNVKLFKSETEGIMLVRLMDISLTPEVQLGRKIYSFSATAYEVAAPTIDNLKKYGILKLDNYVTPEDMNFKRLRISQYIWNQNERTKANNNNNIVASLRREAKASNQTLVRTLSKLHFLRFTFVSPKYPIKDGAVAGHTFYLDGTPYYVLNGVFQINDNDMDLTKIQTLTFETTDDVLVDYIYTELNSTNTGTIKNVQGHKKVAGQIYGYYNTSWNKDMDILLGVKSKYASQKVDSDNFILTFSEVSKIEALHIEAPPGTLFTMIDSQEAALKNTVSRENKLHVMNNTGRMSYFGQNNEAVVEKLQCHGIQLVRTARESAGKIRRIKEEEFQIASIYNYKTATEINKPLPNSIYKINGEYKIYYNGQWCNFSCYDGVSFNPSTTNIIIVDIPVYLIIDYYFDVVSGFSKLNRLLLEEDGNNGEGEAS